MDQPYIPPRAELSDGVATGSRLFSANQVAAATFVGGPVGGVYTLWSNFRTLGLHSSATFTLWLGAAATLLVIATGYLLPENAPGLPLILAQVFAGRAVAERFQFAAPMAAVAACHPRHSNWRVLGVSVACLVATGLVVFPIMYLAFSRGLIA